MANVRARSCWGTAERTAQYGGRMFVIAATLGVQCNRACAMRTRLGENRNLTRTNFIGKDAYAECTEMIR